MSTSNCMCRPYIDTNNPQGMQLGRLKNRTPGRFGTFLTLSLKLMQWYVTSVSRGSIYEKFGNKCVKILKILNLTSCMPCGLLVSISDGNQ